MAKQIRWLGREARLWFSSKRRRNASREWGVLKDAVRHYADECKDMDDAMARLHDPHAHLIDHEEAKLVLSDGIMA